ncbi:desmoplakin-B isoform X3 [Mastacembelus armatus]|uniref:desmoplakin-B isoform X3 n=1 Tax=Mastacembelus armatus TaxID=205130 RepID=UPI000E45C82F|nr:desmoplakin-like isoform X3 [Mastacembelus armatus]
MSMYGSQPALNMSRKSGSKGDLTGWGTYHFERSDGQHGGGNGYDPYMEGYKTISYSKSYSGGGTAGGMGGGMASGMGGGMMSGMGGGMASGMGGGMGSSLSAVHQKAMALQVQCQEYLKKAEYTLQNGGSPSEVERYMAMAKENMEQLKSCAMELRQMGQSNENVVRTLEVCKDQLKGVHMAYTGTLQRKRSTRGSSGGWEEPGRSFSDAIAWIAQQKRLVETASWGDDPAAIEQQLINHQKFHSSIQRSPEVDRAKDDLAKKGDKANLHVLEQEWDNLQQLSFGRAQQLRDLQQIIQQISTAIMWVNDREEEELVFDWGDKNIDQYIPKKQESYSKLMSALEDKEKDLNKLKAKVDVLLKNNHPASDKIEAYQDTLQTQWSWLLQITKCIDIHLKENAAYSQFFKEANETYSTLQKEHETIRKKFTCDKNTSLENLLELLRGLEREREKIMENKRQVQHLVNKSKSIVRLKPRNPEEKSSSPVIVKALCDFKQDQKVICKDNEAILKDNSQRSKWDVTGPGGLDMLVPSVCLIVPPPNPLSVSLAKKNEQYYEAILAIWNQLYINVKSLIAWQYCLLDIKHINSLTMTMLAKMRPEDYRQIFKNLENHFEEFKLSCHNSQMFDDEDKRRMETQVSGAQTHYEQLVVQLPTYIVQQEQIEAQQAAEQQQHLIIIQQQQHQQQAAAEAEARRLEEQVRRMEEERQRAEMQKAAERKIEAKKEVVTKEQTIRKETVKGVRDERKKQGSSSTSSSIPSSYSSSRSLSELHALRLRLEGFESLLSQHVHICFGDDGVKDCGLMITQLETAQRDINSMREEYLRLRERILKELEGINDPDKAEFLRSEIEVINKRLGSLESISSAYLQRLQALRDMLQSIAQVEDIVKVHEARLTEKETTSLSTSEVQDYVSTLKSIKAELELKKNVLASMETQLANVSHWNSQVGGPYYRCDMMLSKYTEQVGLLSDRWKRIQGQIDTRLQDLQLYLPQLQHYTQTSTSLTDWIDATRKKQDSLQNTKIETVQALNDHINKQKALNTEIKAKRETVDSVLKDNDSCVRSVKDYETDLASYTSGLETLLNIPIKRTMLKSPTMDLNQEATQLQTRYMELFTLSGDYYKFLGELLKSMEELKIRNTRIDLLEEELRLLRENVQDHSSKNKSLEDALARYQLQLSQSQEQLLSIEEVKRNTAMQCSATKDSLNTTQSQLSDLNDQVGRLNYLLEEEKRKRRLAEERYTHQQEEYELVLRKRQKELETVSWSKLEVEKSVATKDQELEQLRRQLADEAAKAKELQKELSKTTAMMQSIQSEYSDIVKERDALLLKLQLSENGKDRLKMLEDELGRIKLSLDSELRNKQRLQEENDRVKRDLSYWKDQYDSKQSLIRQYDTDKEYLEREKNALKSEIERLMRELRELEETYKSRLSTIQKEMHEMTTTRIITETELRRTRESSTLDASTLIFDGVRKPVTANQLLDCGVLDKPTFSQLVNGQKTVPEVSVDKKVNLKGTGPIAGVVVGSQGKMSLSEAKKQMLLPDDSANLLLEAQAATGHIIDPRNNQKLTVEEACARGVVDIKDRDRLLAAEAAAVGYKHPSASKPLSVFEAMQKGLIDKRIGVRLLQAQESVGGILDPNLSVFLPKDVAIKHNILDENFCYVLNQNPTCYLDPDTENDTSYEALKRRCKLEPHTGLLLLPITERQDPSKLIFDGVRKTVTAQQLLDCGVLDKPTFNQLIRGEKTVPDVSVDKKVFLKGTGSIAGVAAGPLEKLSFTDAKNQKIMSPDSTDMLLVAQAATGHIIDPRTNQKLTVEEACAKGVVNKEDESKLFAAEAAAVGYKDRNTGNLLSVGQAMNKGLIDKNTALRFLQAQESLGGILDPILSVFLPKDIAKQRNLIDEDLYQALNRCPECYVDPDTQQPTTYISLKRKCKTEPSTGLLLLPEPKMPLTVRGLRGEVSVIDLVDANLLKQSDVDQVNQGRLTRQDIEDRLRSYLRGSTCIAGVYDEANDKVIPIYQAMKDGLLRRGTTLELLEAQAASGFMVDPINNLYLTVSDAYSKNLFGPEFKDSLLAAESAVTGYKTPGTNKIISLFQAMEKGLIEKGHGIRLLQAQIASGGIIDPEHSHRIDVNVAYKRGYFNEAINKILTDEGDETKGFFDPNTDENLTYLQLKKRCITDKKTGLILLPIMNKKKQESTQKNTTRKRRVLIVDPETNREMTVREAYDKKFIDYDTYLELSQQECEWDEITITAPDGSVKFVIIDRKTGRQYDISELLEKKVIDQSVLDKYRSHVITLTEFADIITNKTTHGSFSSSTARPMASSSTSSSSTSRKSETSSASSSVLPRPLSPSLAKMTTTRTTTVTERSSTISSVSQDLPGSLKHISSVSVNLPSQEPVGAIFDTENVEKISITEALNRGLVDAITAQRLLEAQACTGGIINPANGRRLSIQEASRLGIINDEMATKLKPAQKAYLGFEDVKTKKKMSVAQAMKEMWVPYEAGQRFMEFQFVTGGLYDPEMECRRTLEDALKMGWLDERAALKLQDIKSHAKNLTCPKSKLKISYKEALDNSLVEESTGVRMLQASSVSSRGISSPYNVSSAPGSTTGSRSGSRQGSRRSSVDLSSPSSSLTGHYSYSFTSFSSTR